MQIHELKPPAGSHPKRRRIGRGLGSGRGTTAGKGTKGQKARAGGGVPAYFEGGQLPLVKRLPHRRGFRNHSRVERQPVNLLSLSGFAAGSVVGPEELAAAGLIRHASKPVVILATGELTVALTVKAQRFSGAAREKIEKAGGTAEVMTGA
ncbi:MAG: 50S ribosomal protein L15 [Chloroflexota bacterium]